MEEFKLEICRKDHVDIKYHSLDQVQMEKVIDDITNKLRIRLGCGSLLFSRLSEILIDQMVLLDINEPNGFEYLISKFNLNIPKDAIVNVIWNNDSADCFEINVLKKYWEYIWYGTSDEMCLLYFQKINFFAMPTDYGTIYYKWL